ncbi:MAG: hypothetical protein ACLP7Q_04190 [Isosphaeraceae bacterium]
MEVVTPENLIALCAFLSVSGATLLIYFVISKAFGRTRSQSSDLAAPEPVPFSGSVPLKSPVAEPTYDEPPVTVAGGRSSGLGALIPLVIVVVLVGCLLQVARVEIRRRFAEVISKTTTDCQLGIEFDKSKTKMWDFQVQPLQLDPVQGRPFPVGPFPGDGWRGVGVPSGFGNGGAPAPGYRPFFR